MTTRILAEKPNEFPSELVVAYKVEEVGKIYVLHNCKTMHFLA